MNTPTHSAFAARASQLPADLTRDFADSSGIGESLSANTNWGGLQGDSDWLPCEAATSGLFHRLSSAYQASGGLHSAEDIALMMERAHMGSWPQLAKMIATRQLIQLRWHDTVWLPLFQFERHDDMMLKDRVRRVVVELRSAFDDWGIAQWFAEPNAWLRHRTPLASIDTNLAMVMQAAQADRFVAGA